MTEEHWRQGQQSGNWISGLFLANVGLVGAVLMLGLVQRWGEVFPRWMIGLAKRRVPIALAVVPASIMSVLFVVTGISIWSAYPQMAKAAAAIGEDIWIVAGPTFLFPVWGRHWLWRHWAITTAGVVCARYAAVANRAKLASL